MSPLIEWPLVLGAVLTALVVALRALLPFRARVALANVLAGRVPDRFRIWIAGRTACENCGAASAGRGRRS